MTSGRFWLVLLIAVVAVLGLKTASLTVFSQTGPQSPLTFNRDVAPIFYEHCAACHRPNDIAPFSVLSYIDVKPWLKTIREQVSTRDMPPWHADPRYGEFSNSNRLTQSEIDTITKWIDTGAQEGRESDLPPLPKSVGGWRIGRPDLVLAMSQDYVIPPHSPDSYVYVTFPMTFKEDKWVQAIEIHPGNKRIVHHVIAHVITPQALAAGAQNDDSEFPQASDGSEIFFKQGSLSRVKADAPVLDDGASDPSGGSIFHRTIDGGSNYSQLLGSYAPGKEPDVYPPGTAKKIPAGSTVVLQIHYSSFHAGMSEDAQTDRTSVGLIFAKEPPHERVVTFTIPNHLFLIPPSAKNHKVTAAYTLERDVQVFSYMPHMHLRGKDMKYEVVYPNGQRQTLLWVPEFRFNWQTVYRLKAPVRLPKGARLIVTAHFDNSANNKYNPDPKQAVRWGDPTYDEMMIGWIEFLIPNETAGHHLRADSQDPR